MLRICVPAARFSARVRRLNNKTPKGLPSNLVAGEALHSTGIFTGFSCHVNDRSRCAIGRASPPDFMTQDG